MMQNYHTFTRDQNFKFLCIFEGVIVEKLKGGSDKVEILVKNMSTFYFFKIGQTGGWGGCPWPHFFPSLFSE